MIVRFKDRIEAISWIVEHAENEGHFEILREQLLFNFIYTEVYFLDMGEVIGEVLLLNDNPFEA